MHRRSLIALAASMPALITARQGHAQQDAEAWVAATEYPAGAMPAEGLVRFAEAARPLPITPRFDAPDGVRSAAMPKAVAEGRFAIGDAFAGALGPLNPVFELSSLPFLATSLTEAKKLLAAARPAYQEALEAQGVTLLYATPWPPTGIWSRRPIATPADLHGLRVRTYDDAGTTTFKALGAAAEKLSFGAVGPRLAAGTLDAVLTSGDGGAGRRLWDHLKHFTEIGYAMPVSFAFGDPKRLEAMQAEPRAALEAAATRTEAALWVLLETRNEANQARMRQNGMTIAMPGAELLAALKAAGASTVAEWEDKAGTAGGEILAAYRAA